MIFDMYWHRCFRNFPMRTKLNLLLVMRTTTSNLNIDVSTVIPTYWGGGATTALKTGNQHSYQQRAWVSTNTQRYCRYKDLIESSLKLRVATWLTLSPFRKPELLSEVHWLYQREQSEGPRIPSLSALTLSFAVPVRPYWNTQKTL